MTRSQAQQIITTLLRRADTVYPDEKAHRYVQLARRIAQRYTISMPQRWKRRICSHCQRFLQPGDNCRVRIRRGTVSYSCLSCGGHMRYPVPS